MKFLHIFFYICYVFPNDMTMVCSLFRQDYLANNEVSTHLSNGSRHRGEGSTPQIPSFYYYYFFFTFSRSSCCYIGLLHYKILRKTEEGVKRKIILKRMNMDMSSSAVYLNDTKPSNILPVEI